MNIYISREGQQLGLYNEDDGLGKGDDGVSPCKHAVGASDS